MKTPRILLPLFLATMFGASLAFAAEAKVAGCCAKAAKDGAACAHPCCADAAKAGKNCAKCGGSGDLAPAAKK